jgi:hypothetical protein
VHGYLPKTRAKKRVLVRGSEAVLIGWHDFAGSFAKLAKHFAATLPLWPPLSTGLPALRGNVDALNLAANGGHDVGRDFHVAVARRSVKLGQAL